MSNRQQKPEGFPEEFLDFREFLILSGPSCITLFSWTWEFTSISLPITKQISYSQKDTRIIPVTSTIPQPFSFISPLLNVVSDTRAAMQVEEFFHRKFYSINFQSESLQHPENGPRWTSAFWKKKDEYGLRHLIEGEVIFQDGSKGISENSS